MWGEEFFFQHTQNPSAELHIVVHNKQYFGSEEVGRVCIQMEAVQRGLQMVSAHGNKAWETYFLLKTNANTSEAFRPGSTTSWFGNKRWGAGWNDAGQR